MDPHSKLLLDRLNQAVERYIAEVAAKGPDADLTELRAAQSAVTRMLAPA